MKILPLELDLDKKAVLVESKFYTRKDCFQTHLHLFALWLVMAGEKNSAKYCCVDRGAKCFF